MLRRAAFAVITRPDRSIRQMPMGALSARAWTPPGAARGRTPLRRPPRRHESPVRTPQLAHLPKTPHPRLQTDSLLVRVYGDEINRSEGPRASPEIPGWVGRRQIRYLIRTR